LLKLVKEIVFCLNRIQKPLILLVGAGYSSIGLILMQNGFDNLVITDVEPDAILFQQSLTKCPNIMLDDILHSKLKPYSFDLILDISLTDVFIRQRQSSLKAMNSLENLLSPYGVVLSLSIFHKPWKRLTSQCWKPFGCITSYAIVENFIRSKRRPYAGGIPHPIGIFLHQRKTEWKQVSFPMKLLSQVRLLDMASGAEDM
jgi:hypothetical protein